MVSDASISRYNNHLCVLSVQTPGKAKNIEKIPSENIGTLVYKLLPPMIAVLTSWKNTVPVLGKG